MSRGVSCQARSALVLSLRLVHPRPDGILSDRGRVIRQAVFVESERTRSRTVGTLVLRRALPKIVVGRRRTCCLQAIPPTWFAVHFRATAVMLTMAVPGW